MKKISELKDFESLSTREQIHLVGAHNPVEMAVPSESNDYSEHDDHSESDDDSKYNDTSKCNDGISHHVENVI